MATDRDLFLAVGNATADHGAGEAADRAWEGFVLHEAPNADSWDAIAALVRRRASKALELALDNDTARAEREETAPREPRGGGGDKVALRDTDHEMVQAGAKWHCLKCQQSSHSAGLVDFCRTTCSPPPPPPAPPPPAVNSVPRASGIGVRKSLGGKALRPTHRLGERDEYCMTFCHVCGKHATEDFRHLEERCLGKSRKGAENLSRIAQSLYPRREGPPKSVLAIMHARLCAEEVARARVRGGPGCVGPVPSAEAAPSAQGAPGRRSVGGPGVSSQPRLELQGAIGPEEEAALWLHGGSDLG